MDRDEQQKIETLLDWHLDQLDDEARVQVENELRSNPKLREISDSMGELLQPLDQWSVPPVAPNLTERVLARVAARERDLPIEKPIRDHPRDLRPFPFSVSRNFVAAAACIALLIGVLVPGVSGLRASANKALCGNNMASIFRGVSAYQVSFGGSLPFAGTKVGASWLPGSESKRPFASNSRHVFLLVKGDFEVAPKHFVCPGCSASKPMNHRIGPGCDDFMEACNVSYASMNLAGGPPSLRLAPSIAYLSDGNPLFVDGRFDASVDPDRTNSRAHAGKGQTVLLLNGSARWMTSPVNDVDRDNFWLAGNIRRYTGVETPVGAHDAHLVPGYPATDPLVKQEY